MDALRQSLDRVSTGKKKAAKVERTGGQGEGGPGEEAGERAGLAAGKLVENLLADDACGVVPGAGTNGRASPDRCRHCVPASGSGWRARAVIVIGGSPRPSSRNAAFAMRSRSCMLHGVR